MKTPEQIENERLAPAGVPAGATHRCAVEGCGIYYRQIAPFHYVTVPRRGRACTHFLRPIAEAGPAPTTAAPAEQPACVNPYHLKSGNHDGKTCYSITPGPAEQLSGKVVCERLLIEHIPDRHGGAFPQCENPRPAEQPGKAADPRPAPPTNEQINRANNWWVANAKHHENRLEELAAYAEHVAAPLREERDRLAGELETAEARLSTARGQAEAFAKTAREARAKVAERDARIVKLTRLLRGVLDERPLDASAPKVWHTMACPRCEIHAFPTNPLCLRHEIAAAIGAPEGQPSEISQEAFEAAIAQAPARLDDLSEDDIALLDKLVTEAAPHCEVVFVSEDGDRLVLMRGAAERTNDGALGRLIAEVKRGRAFALAVNARLEKYGAHRVTCAAAATEDDADCTCGLAAAVVPPAAPSEAPPPREQELLGKEGVLQALQDIRNACARIGVDRSEGAAAAYAEERAVRALADAGCDATAGTLHRIAAPSSPEEQLSGKELK